MLQNNLVQVNRGEIFTTSKIVAEKLEVSHKDFLRTIEKLLERNKNLDVPTSTPKFSQKFIKTEFEHGKTKIKYDGYLLNEPAFIKTIMQLGKYKKADIIQDDFIQAFFQMKEALQNQSNNSWIEARKEGKVLRRQETDILKELLEYIKLENPESSYLTPKSKFNIYTTYTNMTNKYLQLIVDNKEGKPIRDLSSPRDLGFIGIIDDRCKNCIIDGMNRKLPYKEIFIYTKDEINKLCDSLDFKPKLGN